MELRECSINELAQMMETSDMKLFCGAAKRLVQMDSKDAYHVLKKYAFSSDIYKRRYIVQKENILAFVFLWQNS